jgi:predicted GTPase
MIIRLSFLIIILTACATTPAGTFSQSLAAAETADDAVVTTATALLQAGNITSVQAKKILTITDGVNAALTIANTTYQSGDLATANSKVAAAVSILSTVQGCLAAAQKAQPIDTCLAPVSPP